MSHTPGPWCVTHELRPNDEAVCDLVNETWVIKDHHMPLGHWTDDARLIATAPELLAALRFFVEHPGVSQLCTPDSQAMRFARAAIAKATQ